MRPPTSIRQPPPPIIPTQIYIHTHQQRQVRRQHRHPIIRCTGPHRRRFAIRPASIQRRCTVGTRSIAIVHDAIHPRSAIVVQDVRRADERAELVVVSGPDGLDDRTDGLHA